MTQTDIPDSWRTALQARQATHDLADSRMCLRLLHGEDDDMRCDRFGPVCWFYRYASAALSPAAEAHCNAFALAAGAAHWHVHGMHNRGQAPQAWQHSHSAGAPERWQATENDLLYELRAGSGHSPGLFLDQRDNRAWVRQQSHGARVLNLFAYTGGFGLAALAGGATEVVQGDLSRAYLDWARTNAEANKLPADRVEYSAVDARLLVEGCRKRGRRFDGIICDPPSFGRGRSRGGGRGSGLFRVEHDLPELVAACLELLAPGGWMLVSSNYEGFSASHFAGFIASSVRRGGAAIESAPGAGADFRAGGANPLLNSCIVRG